MYSFDNFILRHWDDVQDDQSLFVEEVVKYIAPIYDEIGEKFAINLLNTYRKGKDEFGYFTLTKDIWVLYDKSIGEAAGYEVVTQKRGGSIKVGPTILRSMYQRKGLAKKIIAILEESYSKQGFRKIYATSPINHLGAAYLDYNELGWKTDAIMVHQYRIGEAERVAGKVMLKNYVSPPKIQGKLDDLDLNQSKMAIDVGLRSNKYDQFISLLEQLMPEHYDGIDRDFCISIIQAETRIHATKEEKGKAILTFSYQDELVGVIISTPKRGGSVKLSPFLLRVGFRSKDIINQMLANIILWYKRNFPQYKRFYILIPDADYYLIRVVTELEWNLEGILKEPYKAGVDVLLFAKEEQ